MIGRMQAALNLLAETRGMNPPSRHGIIVNLVGNSCWPGSEETVAPKDTQNSLYRFSVRYVKLDKVSAGLHRECNVNPAFHAHGGYQSAAFER